MNVVLPTEYCPISITIGFDAISPACATTHRTSHFCACRTSSEDWRVEIGESVVLLEWLNLVGVDLFDAAHDFHEDSLWSIPAPATSRQPFGCRSQARAVQVAPQLMVSTNVLREHGFDLHIYRRLRSGEGQLTGLHCTTAGEQLDLNRSAVQCSVVLCGWEGKCYATNLAKLCSIVFRIELCQTSPCVCLFLRIAPLSVSSLSPDVEQTCSAE